LVEFDFLKGQVKEWKEKYETIRIKRQVLSVHVCKYIDQFKRFTQKKLVFLKVKFELYPVLICFSVSQTPISKHRYLK